MDTFAPPDNVEDYADFVTAVVDRYRGRALLPALERTQHLP